MLTELPVAGRVPRFELDDWRTEFGVIAGITGRGEANVPFDFALGESPPALVLERWVRLQSECGASGAVVSRQVHGIGVEWHSERSNGLRILEGKDGHATSTPGLLIAVTVADCIPVFLHDPTTRSIALLHAGWRGTAAGVLRAGIQLLEAQAGSSVEDLVMHCGPGICGSCYEVGPEVRRAILPEGEGARSSCVDLRAELARQGRAAGVRGLTRSPMCTKHHHDSFFSHRGSAGTDGRMVAYMMLLP